MFRRRGAIDQYFPVYGIQPLYDIAHVGPDGQVSAPYEILPIGRFPTAREWGGPVLHPIDA